MRIGIEISRCRVVQLRLATEAERLHSDCHMYTFYNAYDGSVKNEAGRWPC